MTRASVTACVTTGLRQYYEYYGSHTERSGTLVRARDCEKKKKKKKKKNLPSFRWIKLRSERKAVATASHNQPGNDCQRQTHSSFAEAVTLSHMHLPYQCITPAIAPLRSVSRNIVTDNAGYISVSLALVPYYCRIFLRIYCNAVLKLCNTQ